MKTLQKLTGIASILQALIYISAFIFFGAAWSFPFDGSVSEKMLYLAENQLAFSLINLLMYVVFGCLLAVMVFGLYERLKAGNKALTTLASIFGLVWVTLVIASGMLANIGLAQAITLMDKSISQAFDLWVVISVIVEALGGGNELVGGLWVLLLSLAAIQVSCFSKFTNYLGIFVGLAGIATIYPADTLTEIFGVSQIIWFIALGINLLKDKSTQQI